MINNILTINNIIIFFCFFLIFLFLFSINTFKNTSINTFKNTSTNMSTNSLPMSSNSLPISTHIQDNPVNNIINTKVYFFNASWCGHCTAFKPTWNEFVESIKDTDNIKTIDINCDDDNNSDLINKYDVQGFPTIIIEKNNETINYSGNRTVVGLRQALDLDTDDINNNDTDIRLTVYNFNTKSCGYSVRFQPVWDQFTKAVTDPKIKILDVKCDTNNPLCNKFDIEGYPTVIKEDHQTKDVVFYNGPRTLDGLLNFIRFQ